MFSRDTLTCISMSVHRIMIYIFFENDNPIGNKFQVIRKSHRDLRPNKFPSRPKQLSFLCERIDKEMQESVKWVFSDATLVSIFMGKNI